MSRAIYVNGHYVLIREPSVEVEDRGLQFVERYRTS